MTIFEQLKAEFPREAVSWRAQNVTKDGDKALALAYIDARDVMNRLDDVCGPENWEDAYVETAKGRVIATIRIRVGDEWISKSDGAGDTDIEGDKGGISDAFKRAAVKWGVGRYLYDIKSPWVPCQSYERNGKRAWQKWTDDPWKYVKAAPALISDADRANILALAQTARVSLQTICERENISSLDELTATQAKTVINSLNLTIQKNTRKAA